MRLQAELDLRRMETTMPGQSMILGLPYKSWLMCNHKDYAAILLRCAMETSIEEYVRQISFYSLQAGMLLIFVMLLLFNR
jgi:hypothetical protein